MEAPGRQTPGERAPRFRPRDARHAQFPESNPYLSLHRSLPDQVIPADLAWKYREKWGEVFGRTAPLHLEVGCGNGSFLAGMAALHPESDWLGLEIRYKQTVLTARRLALAGAANARVIRYHAGFLDDLFEDGSLGALYLNHPDPWPKKRHDKHLLVSRWFLAEAARLLVPGGRFRMKTDYATHIDRLARALAEGPALPFATVGASSDIARDGAPWPGDVETNYQQKMRAKSIPVHGVELVRV